MNLERTLRKPGATAIVLIAAALVMSGCTRIIYYEDVELNGECCFDVEFHYHCFTACGRQGVFVNGEYMDDDDQKGMERAFNTPSPTIASILGGNTYYDQAYNFTPHNPFPPPLPSPDIYDD